MLDLQQKANNNSGFNPLQRAQALTEIRSPKTIQLKTDKNEAVSPGDMGPVSLEPLEVICKEVEAHTATEPKRRLEGGKGVIQGFDFYFDALKDVVATSDDHERRKEFIDSFSGKRGLYARYKKLKQDQENKMEQVRALQELQPQRFPAWDTHIDMVFEMSIKKLDSLIKTEDKYLEKHIYNYREKLRNDYYVTRLYHENGFKYLSDASRNLIENEDNTKARFSMLEGADNKYDKLEKGPAMAITIFSNADYKTMNPTKVGNEKWLETSLASDDWESKTKKAREKNPKLYDNSVFKNNPKLLNEKVKKESKIHNMMLEKGISQIQKEEKVTLYRGASLFEEEYNEVKSKKNMTTTKADSSTVDLAVAENFAFGSFNDKRAELGNEGWERIGLTNEYKKEGEKNKKIISYITELNVSNARDIEKISTSPHEKELLIPAETQFLLINETEVMHPSLKRKIPKLVYGQGVRPTTKAPKTKPKLEKNKY